MPEAGSGWARRPPGLSSPAAPAAARDRPDFCTAARRPRGDPRGRAAPGPPPAWLTAVLDRSGPIPLGVLRYPLDPEESAHRDAQFLGQPVGLAGPGLHLAMPQIRDPFGRYTGLPCQFRVTQALLLQRQVQPPLERLARPLFVGLVVGRGGGDRAGRAASPRPRAQIRASDAANAVLMAIPLLLIGPCVGPGGIGHPALLEGRRASLGDGAGPGRRAGVHEGEPPRCVTEGARAVRACGARQSYRAGPVREGPQDQYNPNRFTISDINPMIKGQSPGACILTRNQ